MSPNESSGCRLDLYHVGLRMSAKECELDLESDRGWWKQVFVLFLAENCHDPGLSGHFCK